MAQKPEVIVYSNGRIVDGRRNIPNGYLITEGAAIVAVGAGDPKRGASSGGIRHVDLAGRTMLPGLIDCHVHLTMRAEAAPTPIVSPIDQMVALMHASVNALNTLHGGVTTVRDCGAPHAIDFALRRAAEDGLCLTPRLGAERSRVVHDRRTRLASARPGGRRRRPGQACRARANQGRR